MSDTPNLTLPLLAASQAQKHVTVNEALVRLDALSQIHVLSADLLTPPAALDGDAYIVPVGAIGEWSGQDDRIAIFDNGGWIFATPREGWDAWVASEAQPAKFAGGRWVRALAGSAAFGAATTFGLITGDETLSGAAVATSVLIPDRAIVLGVTARVLSDVSGAGVAGWRIGVAGAEDRYGSSIGLVKDSTANSVTGAPVAYFADTPLVLTAEGGAFEGGQVRLAVHFLSLTPPDAV